MNPNENCKEVIANDNAIKRQVSGIVQEFEKVQKPNELMNQELYFRAIGR